MPSVSSPLRVFVSHSSKDHAFATQLVRDLQAALGHEHTVWYDEHSLTGGDEWWPMIVRELNQCNVFVVILSPDAMKSRWVLDEINIAWKRKNSPANIRFIPLLHFPCNVRGDLETLQIISFLAPKPYDVAFKELLKAIQPLSKALRPRSAADNRLSSSLEQPISFTLFSYLSRRHEEQLWAEAQEEGIHSVVEEVKKPLSSDPKAPRLTRRQILVAGLVGLAVVGGGVRLAEVFISRSDQSTPPRSLSASLQYTYFDPHTDNSSKTGVLVTSVASSPNGKTIASASYDKTVKLWGSQYERRLHQNFFWSYC